MMVPPPRSEPATYAAFISYRRHPEDSRWAERLGDALARFETPEALIRQGYPRRVGRVFRDDRVMPAQSDLSASLKSALWESEFLLVVCSPRTPNSAWVRKEILLFQHWGRGDRILALLTEGSPDESFPPELRRMRAAGEGPETVFELTEPAAADVTPQQAKTEAEVRYTRKAAPE